MLTITYPKKKAANNKKFNDYMATHVLKFAHVVKVQEKQLKFLVPVQSSCLYTSIFYFC